MLEFCFLKSETKKIQSGAGLLWRSCVGNTGLTKGVSAVRFKDCCLSSCHWLVFSSCGTMWNSNFMFRPSRSCFGLAGINKRKMEADPSDYQLHPNKVLITEEKMVSQLKGIHLSQDFTTHGDPGPSNVDSPRSSLPTLVMCDEIRELQNKVQSPIPPQIYSNLRPTNALVLWRPPAGELGKYLSNIRDSAKEEAQQANLDVDMADDDNNNNNNNDISSSQNFNATFSTPV